MLFRLNPIAIAALCAFGLLVSLTTPAAAQRFRPSMPEPISDDTTGFEPIFDGKTLDGWDGDTNFWRAGLALSRVPSRHG